jgi:putative redox protein
MLFTYSSGEPIQIEGLEWFQKVPANRSERNVPKCYQSLAPFLLDSLPRRAQHPTYMKIELKHEKGLQFVSTVRERHHFNLDTPNAPGTDTGATPKEMLLAAVAGCSAMDVVSLLGKYKVPYHSLNVSASAETTDTQPKVFTQIDLLFEINADENAAPDRFIESIEKSLTLYCGVSAMVNSISPIFYTLRLNGEIQGRGRAKFTVDKTS